MTPLEIIDIAKNELIFPISCNKRIYLVLYFKINKEIIQKNFDIGC